MVRPSVPRRSSRKRQFLFADGKVAGVDDFGRDVHAVLKLERNQVRLTVLHFLEGGLFARATLDIGERVVVVDGGNEKWFASCFCIKRVIELELRCVTGTEMINLLGGLNLRGANLLHGLRP